MYFWFIWFTVYLTKYIRNIRIYVYFCITVLNHFYLHHVLGTYTSKIIWLLAGYCDESYLFHIENKCLPIRMLSSYWRFNLIYICYENMMNRSRISMIITVWFGSVILCRWIGGFSHYNTVIFFFFQMEEDVIRVVLRQPMWNEFVH